MWDCNRGSVSSPLLNHKALELHLSIVLMGWAKAVSNSERLRASVPTKEDATSCVDVILRPQILWIWRLALIPLLRDRSTVLRKNVVSNHKPHLHGKGPHDYLSG